MSNPNGTPSPNVAMHDAIGRIWSLKTTDDGSGNQIIAITNDGQNASGLYIPTLVGTKAYFVTANAAGNTVIMPAVAGSRFFITAIYASLNAGSTLASAGLDTISIEDGSSVIIADQVYVPAAAVTTEGSAPIYALTGLNYVSQAANQALNINLSAALTAGGINITVLGGYSTTATP